MFVVIYDWQYRGKRVLYEFLFQEHNESSLRSCQTVMDSVEVYKSCVRL